MGLCHSQIIPPASSSIFPATSAVIAASATQAEEDFIPLLLLKVLFSFMEQG